MDDENTFWYAERKFSGGGWKSTGFYELDELVRVRDLQKLPKNGTCEQREDKIEA